nr:leucine-rich repeat-containing protein 63 isoform X1 [Pelodiscus sinensis]XP_025037883.1 leucine-rich repeat-containing protein 63 isoform X1 [Pelodiscus sinensis]XP_025037884.1 leucine-rich repeat-containing protein 63 isoform X1 [Pelodiscus sinensis]XP_025037885.1 leucine-rich repeat-containing protein 63 isoform X1 [Pelodiscus sinensis]XP_025037886.1 leucine-rich repeat-containing protein 63 isoform X1 [Pelodiscus sinensis]|eukprot:XP_006118070.1 leucine-rich repeat-containing protein 63 isoform X1 [Pelodiscus sinensis]
MYEQPKLLRRPLPPKLLPELSMPKERTNEGRIPGKHQLGMIRCTNDEDSHIFSSSYVSGQTQVQPKDRDFLLDQNLKEELTLTAPYSCAPASCSLQKDGSPIDMEVLAPLKSDSVYWRLSGIATAASTTDKDRTTFSGSYSSGRTSVQLKIQNLLPDSILKKNIIITPTPSGPASFPLHKCRKSFHMQVLGLPKDEPVYFTLPKFNFGSLAVSSSHPLPLIPTFRKPVVSLYNCQKLTTQFTNSARESIQSAVNTVILSDNDLPVISQRKPERQAIIEMALEEKMRKANSSEPILEGDEGKETFTNSLKLYANGQRKNMSYSEPNRTFGDHTVKGIQGFGYQNTLSEEAEQEQLMARSRIAVLYCSMHRRTELNLKGYFLTLLPDLTPLVNTLVYLNLSFNDLHFFPREVYNIKHLQVLKLRNNPIREIPDDIYKLKALRILNISFSLLSALPTGLFLLPYLNYLDVAYNDISIIPHEIRNLRTLEYLNVEGNQLCALPCEVLKLPLKFLNIENNFMHPFLWKENSQNQPQRLTDLAALCFSRNKLWQKYTKISRDIQEILNNCKVCDCCKGPLYGKGLQLIRSCRNIFRFHRLPFLFNACSPSCHSSFMSQTDSMTRVLYGN